jgi:hypothetical protein
MIHIGDTADGRRVEIPVHHTGIFGATGTGKTTLLKYMLSQVEGFQTIIFDSKVTGAEFDGVGVDVPFYIEESTDPDVFRSLIEGMRLRGRANMERFRGGFIEVCNGAKTFDEIGINLIAKLSDPKVRGYTRAMYQEIQYDYNRLMDLIREQDFMRQLPFDEGEAVVRIPTTKLPNLALQGLVVRSVVERVLKTRRNVIFLIDEAPNFVSQRRYNPAKDALQLLDAQGRSKSIFGWYSGQTLTGFDKSNMKNLWYWIMGREMERNEAKDVYDTQTFKALAIDQIKQLKVREFIVSTPDFTEKVTVPQIPDERSHNPPLDDWSEIGKRLADMEAALQSG